MVVFPARVSDGDRQCVNVTILLDDVIEGTENFFLVATSVGMSSLIVVDSSISRATVFIADSASK